MHAGFYVFSVPDYSIQLHTNTLYTHLVSSKVAVHTPQILCAAHPSQDYKVFKNLIRPGPLINCGVQ
jgi:hypothetical protein